MESHHHGGVPLSGFGKDDGRNLMNRMVFLEQVTAHKAIWATCF